MATTDVRGTSQYTLYFQVLHNVLLHRNNEILKGNRTVLALCLQTQNAYTNESTGSEYANSKHEKISDPNAVTAQSLGKSDVTIYNEHYM